MRQYIDTLQDVQGNALVGATVLVQNYIGGANASIFSDNGLTPIVTSTVTTGADGQFSFFAADGDYNLVMSKNATVFKTQSPVSLFDGTPQITYADSGAANAYAVTNSALEKALRPGLRASFTAAHGNTGACTFQYNGLAIKPLVFPAVGALLAATIVVNGIYGVEYDGTNWQMKSAIGTTPVFAQTAAEAAVPVVPTSLSFDPWRGEDVRRIGVTGNGATDDRAALFSANSIGSALYFPPGTYKISSNLTFTVPLIFDFGAILKPDAGVTVTINAPVMAGPWQIFNEANAGATIAGLIRPVNAAGRMYFEWWGAVGDNATDDTIPCQATLRAAMTANYVGIQMLPKQYRLTATLNANGNTTQSFKAPSIYGVGKHLSQFTGGAAFNNYFLSYIGGSGTFCDAVVEDVGFSGVANQPIAFKINGQCGLRIHRCLFDNLQVGIHFWNFTAGSFSEYNVADECEFTFNCLVPLYYQVSAGTNSFHGSGITRSTIVTNTAGPLIQINAGCRVYNAPLDTQVWYAGNATLVGNLSAIQCYFRGSLTLENSGGGVLTLASGSATPYAGTITASAGGVAAGTFVQAQAVAINTDTTLSLLGGRRAYKQTMATGANILDGPFNSQHRTVFIRFVAAGYDYRYFLSVDPSGSGIAGAVGTLANLFALNTAGYGAPAFSVNATGQLVATNAAWPAATVTAYWSDQTQSFGNESGVPSNVIQF